VSKDDFEAVDKRKEELKKQFESLEAFSLRPREDVTPGGCIIETEVGIINATIENQWAIIEKAFEKLWKDESE
jgi:type III secretion protein L